LEAAQAEITNIEKALRLPQRLFVLTSGMSSIENAYQAQRAFFATGATLPYQFRKKQLRLLLKAVRKYEQQIMDALYKDLHKPPVEAYGGELGQLYAEIKYLQNGLKKWMQPEAVSSPFTQYPSKSKIHRAPLGLTLIIAPWNYPFQLLMAPLAAAIAAGNCAVLKPSEMTPHTAAVIETLVKETFNPAFVTVVQGDGSTVIPALMQHRFDHVFFTGSTNVGRKIMEMATPHLTPVTLELGGKSPCIVDEHADIHVAAKRIVWGKFWNAGQTCIAPDYVLVHHLVKDKLVEAMKKAMLQFWGATPQDSSDYARIINASRFATLQSYLSQGRVLHGGEHDAADKYIAPTLIDDVSWESPLMQEEIFGPILPILTFEKITDVLERLQQLPYPLSLYVFTKRKATEHLLMERLRFGGGCVNNTLVHFVNPELPFGGVGNSGMGRYHGKYGFETFTHLKAVMRTGTWVDVPMKYPPYKGKLKWLKLFMK
jgi:aldehyde dehydrogenase (NAD+)